MSYNAYSGINLIDFGNARYTLRINVIFNI